MFSWLAACDSIPMGAVPIPEKWTWMVEFGLELKSILTPFASVICMSWCVTSACVISC